jgi:hypothetical protein
MWVVLVANAMLCLCASIHPMVYLWSPAVPLHPGCCCTRASVSVDVCIHHFIITERIGYNRSYLACRTRHLVTVWQPLIGSMLCSVRGCSKHHNLPGPVHQGLHVYGKPGAQATRQFFPRPGCWSAIRIPPSPSPSMPLPVSTSASNLPCSLYPHVSIQSSAIQEHTQFLPCKAACVCMSVCLPVLPSSSPETIFLWVPGNRCSRTIDLVDR